MTCTMINRATAVSAWRWARRIASSGGKSQYKVGSEGRIGGAARHHVLRSDWGPVRHADLPRK